MSGTLYSLDLLNSGIGLVLAGLIGVLFGFFLEQAGFGSSRRLTGIFYFQDMAVLKVMFTAVVVALLGLRFLIFFGWLDPRQVLVLDTYWGAQIVGGLIFGVGFVMGGWCPGTAFVGLASAKLDALVFLVGAVLGSIAFNEVFPLLKPLYEGWHVPDLYLYETLHLDAGLLTLLFCVVAVVAFIVSSWLERWFGRQERPDRQTRERNAAAALLLLALALLAMRLPEPSAEAAPVPAEPAVVAALRSVPPSGLLGEVAAEADHIEPQELADLLMAGRPRLQVVDIRPADAYDAFHLPGAVNLPLEALAAESAQRVSRSGQVVLVSNGTTHAAQAWMELRRQGWTNVRVLTDGMLGFWRECLTPPSLSEVPAGPQAAQALSEAFRKRRALFLAGGSPGSGPAAPPRPTAEEPAAVPPAPALAEPGLEKHVVSTAWLAERLTQPGLKLVDVRPKSTDYTTGHLPGALYLNPESLRTTIEGVPAMVVPAVEIAVQLGRLGIGNGDTVILYSDNLRDATLVAMALARVGHGAYAVLHGGIRAWVAEKQPLSKDLPRPAAAVYTPVDGADTFTVGVDGVKAALGDGKTVILDVRPADYFAGKKSDEARPGHIPGAVNREFTLDLVPGQDLWQAADRLQEAYAKLGVTPDKPVIVHCRTGHQASQTYFLLKHVLGFPDVRWFDASWSAWAARPDLPAETGTP